jgi:hypothetical protein|tara:strand:+ start:635 stop:859 length:225 start_codon:yes stop_codon:yes gene_type:complete
MIPAWLFIITLVFCVILSWVSGVKFVLNHLEENEIIDYREESDGRIEIVQFHPFNKAVKEANKKAFIPNDDKET